MRVDMQERVASEEPEAERLRSFDVLASVDMFRFDLQHYGYVLPETRQRAYDEEMTYVSEGINRPLATSFTLREHNGALVYFNKGKWDPYVDTLEAGLKTARQEALEDPRKAFEVDIRLGDLAIVHRLEKLRPGETFAWDSPFPEKACRDYGEKLVGGMGYQPARRLGFLYHAERNADRSLTLKTQSVDGSDQEAFEAARGQADIASMLAAYDRVMGEKLGGEFHAGRRINAHIPEENAWQAIERHSDLLAHYMGKIESLAEQESMPRSELEIAKKRLTYGVWAALKLRLDKEAASPGLSRNNAAVVPRSAEVLDHEMHYAYRFAAQRGEIMFGCGGSLEADKALLEAETKDVFDMIFDGNDENAKIPNQIRCIKCRAKSPKEQVVKEKSWCCPHCKYEIDICTGAELNPSDASAHKFAVKLGELVSVLASVGEESPPESQVLTAA